MKTLPLAPYLQRFFTERLSAQMTASPNTIASYRDTFRLLLKHAAATLAKKPTDLKVADIDADLVGAFLADIESTRGNSACIGTASSEMVRQLTPSIRKPKYTRKVWCSAGRSLFNLRCAPIMPVVLFSIKSVRAVLQRTATSTTRILALRRRMASRERFKFQADAM